MSKLSRVTPLGAAAVALGLSLAAPASRRQGPRARILAIIGRQ